ncbi:DUF5134 domain-containing protein [Saccharothrix sp. ST-888]|uniref:DUF5134 domain-containing protein n=1 Tax=Saccharothrix sp. ST-888 TaxID=1427391 RepID=UPI0005ED3EFF|nr:DUF5134 domain-containing protein [Saccharothrix sp. ST-888]KJK57939.1 hypothetical protein UK12_13205 [Saccharothrix sp. ST-888]
MHGPALVTWLLAALAVGSSGYCLARLRSPGPSCGAHGGAGRGRAAHESDVAEALMGLGMAGMALRPGTLWGWPFALLAATQVVAALRPGSPALRAHRLHHGIGALAMAYMALTMADARAHEHAHHGTSSGLPLLTGALLLYFGCYALWSGSRLLSVPGAVVAGGTMAAGTAAADGVSRACRLAMGVGMFAMLLSM